MGSRWTAASYHRTCPHQALRQSAARERYCIVLQRTADGELPASGRAACTFRAAKMNRDAADV